MDKHVHDDLKKMVRYESVGFEVIECDSKEQAMKEVEQWMDEYFDEANMRLLKQRATQANDDPFVGNEFAKSKRK